MLHTTIRYTKALSAVFALTLFLTGCKEDAVANKPVTPIAFEPSDECHVCGMAMYGFPGPKGEAFEGREKIARKFCSTRDLMAWYLQPENTPNTYEIFVHDMGRSDWNRPDDAHLIDARKAVFVVGSNQQGAMGPTLASFADQPAAQTFAKAHGGKVFTFDELTLDVITHPTQFANTPSP
ncbi:MAG: nitrous oxide reductase accessory protein NosL [Hahellaceae bacterium]|nr:nitrous oxide reductase accessory protein NosL [Hahellaceae bacterium]